VIHNIALKITNYLVKNGACNYQKEDLYVYGIEIIIEKIITFSILMIMAVYTNITIPSALFIIFFLALRRYTGGFHANSYFGCLFSTVAIYLICSHILMPVLMKEVNYVLFGVIISSIIIYLFAPINHPNMNLNPNEIKILKRKAEFVLLLELGLIAMAFYLGIFTVYIIFSSMGIILCAVLLIVAKIIRQEVRENEKQFS
jgi:accessory gene regulator B